MQLELNSDEGSDEDFVGDTDDNSESLDGSEFVPESQCRWDILLPAPASIPNLSSGSNHFHTLHLHDMGEEPKEGFCMQGLVQPVICSYACCVCECIVWVCL
ncbi:hypothetical protein PIB30_105254 [Stylosanthes scabra]|uniref:Uncharacterized protein n=1 Tax=Stylosanthes scabra TaxID=79078 RepID=A0ABU6UXP2_9FABA|nr:hypothetical protein [Stylosanthes scabra]